MVSCGREAEHHRHVRAVDVAVENADAAAAARQRQRQVDGHRRLADAALARADGDDVLHAGQRRLPRLRRRGRADARRHLHVDIGTPGSARTAAIAWSRI